jgi:hypothetical protein
VSCAQLHLLDEWALNNDLRHFRQKLQIDLIVFDKLVEMIEALDLTANFLPKSSLLFF